MSISPTKDENFKGVLSKYLCMFVLSGIGFAVITFKDMNDYKLAALALWSSPSGNREEYQGRGLIGDPCACFLVLPHHMGKTIKKIHPV